MSMSHIPGMIPEYFMIARPYPKRECFEFTVREKTITNLMFCEPKRLEVPSTGEREL